MAWEHDRNSARPRILLESRFSCEQRTISGHVLDLLPHADFRIIYLRHPGLGHPGRTGESLVCLLANPHQAVRADIRTAPGEALLVHLAPVFLLETAARLRLHREGAHLQFRQPLQPIEDDARLGGVLEAIAHELDAADAGWREVIRSLAGQLAVYLLRSHINVIRSGEIELSRAGMVDRRLRRAIEFMHDHCGRELRLDEIAGAAYLSEFHFARLFKKITGATPHQYLAALRVERARRLLAETDRPIVEIGAEVGYASQSHFTKIFRDAVGLTPRAFREAVRETV
jgi:AraC family transcriptional regulator